MKQQCHVGDERKHTEKARLLRNLALSLSKFPVCIEVEVKIIKAKPSEV